MLFAQALFLQFVNQILGSLSTILAGVIGIAMILLVIGLGWHSVWNGITEGAMTVKNVIIQVINYYSSDQSGTGNPNRTDHDSSVSNSHGHGLSKA
jgi:hypothetical protein